MKIRSSFALRAIINLEYQHEPNTNMSRNGSQANIKHSISNQTNRKTSNCYLEVYRHSKQRVDVSSSKRRVIQSRADTVQAGNGFNEASIETKV